MQLQFKVNSELDQMTPLESNQIPADFTVQKFEKYQPMDFEGAKKVAIIKVWKIAEEEKRIDAVKTYYFKDPIVITDKLNQKSSYQQVIFTTVDGEAFVLSKKDGRTSKDLFISVIDQDWPKNRGPLPIDL